jgi:hypothetical protein
LNMIISIGLLYQLLAVGLLCEAAVIDKILTVNEYNELDGTTSKFRVMYGQDVELGQFPYIVTFGGCTGSLLDASTVLTAVHCVCDGQLWATAGALHRRDSSPQTQERRVVSIHKNPRHETEKPGKCKDPGTNDVAIMKLDRPFDITPYVRPIDKIYCDPTVLPRGTPIINAGYGYSRKNVTGILRYGLNTLGSFCQIGIPFWCSDLRDDNNKRLNVVARGDSGGPVVRVLPDGKFEQVAINSGANDLRGFYAPTNLNCDWLRSVGVNLP